MSVGPVSRDDATAEFFDAAAAGQFLLRQCPVGHYSEPPAAQCTTCGATALSWTPAGGGATLVSWTVSYGRAAGTEPPPQTVLVIAELDEGPWWWSQLAGSGAGLTVGARLRIEFERAGPDYEAVPVFALA